MALNKSSNEAKVELQQITPARQCFFLHQVGNTADSTGRSRVRRSASSERGFFLNMGVFHWLLTSVLFLLLFITDISAQQQGKLLQGIHDHKGITPWQQVAPLQGEIFTLLLWDSFVQWPSPQQEPEGPQGSPSCVKVILSHLCVFPGCSVSNSEPSVYENNPPGYVLTTIHVDSGFTVTIDPTSQDARFFTIQGSELQLTESVDYEVSL